MNIHNERRNRCQTHFCLDKSVKICVTSYLEENVSMTYRLALLKSSILCIVYYFKTEFKTLC